MYILTYMYILAEIPAYTCMQLKCMGGHFFPGRREYYRTLEVSKI